MTEDARRLPTEEELARIHAAKRNGGTCAVCGRALVEGETVWMERLVTGFGGQRGRAPILRQAPVGAECVSAAFRTATEGTDPESCANCGRGVYYGVATGRRHQLATCSRACSGRYWAPRSRERRRS